MVVLYWRIAVYCDELKFVHCSWVDIWVNQMDKYSLKSGRSDSCNSFFFSSLYAAHLYLCCFSHSPITCKLHMFAKSQTFIDEKWNTSNNPSNFKYLNTWLNWNVVETECSLSNPVSFLLVRLHFSHFHPPPKYIPHSVFEHILTRSYLNLDHIRNLLQSILQLWNVQLILRRGSNSINLFNLSHNL